MREKGDETHRRYGGEQRYVQARRTEVDAHMREFSVGEIQAREGKGDAPARKGKGDAPASGGPSRRTHMRDKGNVTHKPARARVWKGNIQARAGKGDA
jgi:hypothetical protein